MSYANFGVCTLILFLFIGAFRRHSRIGALCAIGGVLGLFVWGVTPAMCWLLERNYSPLYQAPDADAIVVLSASVDERSPSLPETLPNRATYQRCRYAAWLYRNWLQRPVLASGGAAEDEAGSAIVATIMARTLEEAGVPGSMIWTEERSRSTYENALYSARLLRAKGMKRVVLVTEAYHMARSAACFRKQGLVVVPAPAAFRTRFLARKRWHLLPSVSIMAANEDGLHELAGLCWYRLVGRI